MRITSASFLALSLGAVLLGCSRPPPEPVVVVAPTRIEQLNNSISRVTLTDEQTTSVHLVHPDFDASITLFSLASDALEITGGMRTHKLVPATEFVRFIVFVPSSDNYGNKNYMPVVGLLIRTSEIKKINFESGAFTEFDLLDLSDSVWHREDFRYSMDAVQGFCSRKRQFAPAFCARSSL